MTDNITLEELLDYRCHDFDDKPAVRDAWDYVVNGCSGEFSACSAENWRRHGKERHMRHTPEYIEYLANILRAADTWPFPPLHAAGQSLWNGHHRAQAAILAQWDKPIPIRWY
jgi:hypothetical protein